MRSLPSGDKSFINKARARRSRNSPQFRDSSAPRWILLGHHQYGFLAKTRRLASMALFKSGFGFGLSERPALYFSHASSLEAISRSCRATWRMSYEIARSVSAAASIVCRVRNVSSHSTIFSLTPRMIAVCISTLVTVSRRMLQKI
jgi:hypothetical protein